jgi:hypothetical protein
MAANNPDGKESDITQIIEQATKTKGKLADSFDAAAALLGFTVGFAADLFIFAHSGIPPGTLGGIGAGTAIGIEQGIKGFLNVQRKKGEAETQLKFADEIAIRQLKFAEEARQRLAYDAEEERKKLHLKTMRKVEGLKKILTKHEDKTLLKQLESNLDLWQLEIINDQEFEAELEKVITQYRALER